MSDLKDAVEIFDKATFGITGIGQASDYVLPPSAISPQAQIPTLESPTAMPASPDKTKGARRKAEAQRLKRRRGRASTMLSALGNETLGG